MTASLASAAASNRRPIRVAAAALVVLALAAGTIADRPPRHAPVTAGGYEIMAVDFHVHSSMWSGGTVSPWGLALEAQRQGLDAIALAGHNLLLESELGVRGSRWLGGALVIPSQEITSLDHHIVGAGLQRLVDWKKPAAEQIAAIHAQGGIAIAAHPTRGFSAGFPDEAVQHLDGAELCHPIAFLQPAAAEDLRRFRSRGTFAAIGSSDFHFVGRVGACRTYVFAAERTTTGILDAVRAGRTVVYGADGAPYGDPTLIPLAGQHPELLVRATTDARPSVLDRVSWIAGLLGMLMLALTERSAAPRRDGQH